MEMKERIKTWKKLLDEYGYEYTDEGLIAIYNEFMRNKGELIEKLRKHPNWNEDALAIVFDADYVRQFESEALSEFYSWVYRQIEKIRNENKVVIKSFYNEKEAVKNLKYNIAEAYRMLDILQINKDIMLQNTEENAKDFAENLLNSLKEEEEKVKEEYDCLDRYEGTFILKSINENLEKVSNAMSYIVNSADSHIVSATLAEGINDKCDVGAVEGQKLSRVIGKLCKLIGLDTIVEMKTTESGREYNDGYNRKFAMMSDRINPMTYTRITVVSVNPLDYWTMSFGHGWASCHTIDKTNKRRVDSEHNYHGAYSSGTESYMLDGTSMVYYTVDKSYEGTEYWNEDKMNRCVFCTNKTGSLLLQSRVYPDGRDGGDNSLPKQFREVMQRVISEAFEIPNYWNVRKGSGVCADYTYSYGTHYRDYVEYGDGTLSFNKDVTDYNNIVIGHDPICPVCGEEHGNCENIMCNDCEEGGHRVQCASCGDMFNPERHDDTVYCRDNDRYYCCSSCACDDGVEYCEDDGEYHETDNMYYCEDDGCYHLEDYCYRDDYDDYYYSGSPYIETRDGSYFHSEETAHAAGYIQLDDGDWIQEDEAVYDEYEEVWFDPSDGINTEDGEVFYSEDSARNAGYEEDYNGNWYPEDDLVIDEWSNEYVLRDEAEVHTEDDTWYIDEENARNDDYEKDFNGKWRLKDDMEYDEHSNQYFLPEEGAVETYCGRYFLTEESAKEKGYRKAKDGEWYDKRDVVYDPFRNEYILKADAKVIASDTGRVFLFEDSARWAGYIKNEDGDWVQEVSA